MRLIRTFRRITRKQPGIRGRGPSYDPEKLLLPLNLSWLAANLSCSKRHKAIIPLWLPGYVRTYGAISQEMAWTQLMG
jgi:hypothetical protein